MGQYHVLANLDKREVVVPHALGLGLKQREHVGAFDGTLADALYILTMTSPARGGGDFEQVSISGRWAGDRCVVLGDYTEDSDLPNVPDASSLYREACDEGSDWTDISEKVVNDLGKLFGFRMTGTGWGWRRRVAAEVDMNEADSLA
jgi:hypothetical protein